MSAGTDWVFIDRLSVPACIGVHDWERGAPRLLFISLRLAWDNRPAGRSEDLAQALDYAAVSARVRALATDREFLLLEALAETLADALLHEFGVSSVELRIDKPDAVSGAASVGIEISRQR